MLLFSFAVDTLALIVYPQALSMISFPRFWNVACFFMLLSAGMSCQLFMVEVAVFDVMRFFAIPRRSRWRASIALCIIVYLISLSMATPGGIYINQILSFHGSHISQYAGINLVVIGLVIYGTCFCLKYYLNLTFQNSFSLQKCVLSYDNHSIKIS